MVVSDEISETGRKSCAAADSTSVKYVPQLKLPSNSITHATKMIYESPYRLNSLSCKHSSFLAESSKITVISNINKEKLFFIRESCGPFVVNQRLELPLWLSIQLKKRKLVRILLPYWLNVDYLQHIYKQEKSNDGTFEALPYYYQEIAAILLKECKDEFQEEDYVRSNTVNNDGSNPTPDNANNNNNNNGGGNIEKKIVDVRQKIKVILEDIMQIRLEKLRRGIMNMQEKVNNFHSVLTTKLNNITSMEVNIYRNFISEAMNTFSKLNEFTPSSSSSNTFSSSSATAAAAASTHNNVNSNYDYDEDNYNNDNDDNYDYNPQPQPIRRRRTSTTASRFATYNEGEDSQEEITPGERDGADGHYNGNEFTEQYERDTFYNGTSHNDSIHPQQQLPTRKLRSRRG